jgi:predicted transglutaminase-like cysteine proteinase
MVATPAKMVREPASRTPVSFAPFVAPQPVDECANRAVSPKVRFGQTFPDFSAVAAELDPSSELGTRAIPVRRTRFDDRWNRVRQAPSAGLMHAQLQRAGVTRGLDEAEILQRVNQWVNRQIAYVNDDRNYSQSDFWATADQTLARGSGDCEDFAILKMHMLRAAWVDPDRVKLVLLRDLAANADHAFLLVDSKAGKVVLDNMTDRVYSGADGSSVRPVLSFSGNQRWIHAYRGVQSRPNSMAMAMAAVPAAQKSFAAATANPRTDNQRPVSAEPLTFKTGLSR